MFPRLRFAQAGATPAQIAVLEADFDALPEAGKQSYLDRIGGLAVGDLAELVSALVVGVPLEAAVPETLTGPGPDDEAAQTHTFEVPMLEALAEPDPEAIAEASAPVQKIAPDVAPEPEPEPEPPEAA